MSTIKTTLSYRGRTETVNIYISEYAAVMDPQPSTRSETMNGSVKWASYDPETKLMTYGGRGGEKFGVYDRTKDPEVFIFDWGLRDSVLVKDQTVDGASLSDWTYFNNQAKRIHASCLWGLIHKCGLDKKRASYWANFAVEEFNKDILLSRGVDLKAPIKESDRLNDESIFEKESTRNFYS